MRIILGFLMVALFSTTAFAGGIQGSNRYLDSQVQGVSAKNWTGGYVGISVGTYEQNLTDEDKGFFKNFLSENGSFGGIHVGYDFDLDRWVIGARGEYKWVLEDGTEYYDAKNSWDLIVRAGPKITDNVLLYLLAGYGQISVDDIDEEDTTLSGWKWGVGLELALTDRIHGSVEYQQLFEQSFDEDFLDDDYDSDGSLIRAGISYRF